MAAFTNNKGRQRSPYKKPKREIAKREIGRLIIDEGLTNRQISERLNIPQRSVERYVSELYEHDNQILAGLNSYTEMLTVWNICRDRLDHHRQEIMTNIARNPNAPFKDRMAAWHIICELEAAELRLRQSAPEMVSRWSALPKNNHLVVAKGSTIVNLKLRDKKNEKEEEGQEVDDEEGEGGQEDDSNPLAFTEETYTKILNDKEKIIREQEEEEE